MALVANFNSVLMADSGGMSKTSSSIDKSKENFSNKQTTTSSNNSSVNAVTSKINNLGNEIKEDYEKTSNSMKNYSKKVEETEKKISNKAKSVLENDKVLSSNIPTMTSTSNKSTTTSSNKNTSSNNTKTSNSFADSVKPKYTPKSNDVLISTTELSKTIEDAVNLKTITNNSSTNSNKSSSSKNNTKKNEETVKDLADEFFETQRKNGTFVTSPIQNNNTFASSVKSLNDISTTTTLLDPERISNAVSNTEKKNKEAKKKKEEEKKKKAESQLPYVLDEISDSVGAAMGNPLSIVGNAKNNIFSFAKIGGYAYSGLKSLVTGEKLSDVADETIEKISNIEKVVDDEYIAAKMFLTEGAYSTVENVVKGAVTLVSNAFTGSNESTSNDAENVTSQKGKNTAEGVLENFLGTNWVNKGFNTFYEQTEFGSHLKESVIGFDTQRDIGTAVGSAIPTIAVGIATGGTGAMIVGGLSSAGSSTTSALQEGATLNEATNYGTVKGALTAATFGVGKAINGLTPFGIGTTEKTLGNAGARVLADTGLGAVTGLVDSAVKQLYIPRNRLQEFGYSSEEDWNNASFSDKYNAYFESSGGWDSIKNGALTGAAYSIVFEGASAIKEISTINSANKLYSEVAENNAKINDIKNNSNMLTENNSIANDNLDDLLRDRENLKAAYDNLDAQGKYYFGLSMSKDAINSGNITGAGIDNLLNSGNAKALYNGLSNQERLALFDAMDESQMQSYFNQIGAKEAQKFINKNSSYITDRFFNTGVTNSTWSNSTSLAITSSSLPSTLNTAASNVKTTSIIYGTSLLPSMSKTIEGIGLSTPKISDSSSAQKLIELEDDYLHEIDTLIEDYDKKIPFDNSRQDTLSLIDSKIKDSEKSTNLTHKVNSFYDDLKQNKLSLSEEMATITTTLSGDKVYPKIMSELSKTKEEIKNKISELETTSLNYKRNGTLFSDERNTSKVYDQVKKDYETYLKELNELENNLTTQNKNFTNSLANIGTSSPEKVSPTSTGTFGELLKPLFKNNQEPTLEQKVTLYESGVSNCEEEYLQKADELVEKLDTSIKNSEGKYDALTLTERKLGNSPIKNNVVNSVNSYYEELNEEASRLSEQMANVMVTNHTVSETHTNMLSEISTTKQDVKTKIQELEELSSRYKNNYSILSPERSLSKVYDQVREDYETYLKELDELENKLVSNKSTLDSNIEQLGETTFNETNQTKIKELVDSINKEPAKEILDGISIPRNQEIEKASTKIGFQFFADKKDTFDAKNMPLSSDPKIRIAQEKALNGENLSLSDIMVLGRDHTLKTIGEYECKSNCCYRAIYKEGLDAYLKQGYIGGKGREYEEFIDENGKVYTNNSGVNWYLGGYSKRYGDIVIECSADKKYFTTAIDGGNQLSADPSVKHMKSSPESNPIPISMITNIFDLNSMKNVTELYIPKINESGSSNGVTLTKDMIKDRIKSESDNENKIGFQFFASPKKGSSIISSLLNPSSSATDTFFRDFDNGISTYGVDQGFGRKNTTYITPDNGISISKGRFYSYLSKKYPDMSLEELERNYLLTTERKSIIYNPEEYVSYIADRQTVLNNGVRDINRAIDTFESMTEKVPDTEYLKSQEFLMEKGMTKKEATALLYEIDSTGICTYADIANEILTSFRYDPKAFKRVFGFSMYTHNSAGEKTLNSNKLVLDLYIYANSKSNSATSILRTSSDGSVHINNLNTENQEYLSKDNLAMVDSYLKSKDSSLSYTFKEHKVKPSSVFSVKARIKDALKEGNVGLSINSNTRNEKIAAKNGIELKGDGVTRFLDESGKVMYDTKTWGEGDSHAVFVTGYNDKGVIVSSWGERLIIPYEDLADNFFYLRKSIIGGLE